MKPETPVFLVDHVNSGLRVSEGQRELGVGRGLRSLLWPWPQWAEQAQTWGEGPAADSNGGPSPPPLMAGPEKGCCPSPKGEGTGSPCLCSPPPQGCWDTLPFPVGSLALCSERRGPGGRLSARGRCRAGMGGGGGGVRSWAGRVPWCSHVTQTLAWQHWESLGAWAPGLLPLPGPAPTCLLMGGGCPGMLRRRGASGVSGPVARLTSGGDSAATGLSCDRRGSCCRRDVLGLDIRETPCSLL